MKLSDKLYFHQLYPFPTQQILSIDSLKVNVKSLGQEKSIISVVVVMILVQLPSPTPSITITRTTTITTANKQESRMDMQLQHFFVYS